jgi:hypothetical protein
MKRLALALALTLCERSTVKAKLKHKGHHPARLLRSSFQVVEGRQVGDGFLPKA